MTSPYDFTAEDWDQVTIAPMLVGLAVAKAEDSGFFGSMRETRTLLSTIADEVTDNPAAGLINAAAVADTEERVKGLSAAGPDVLGEAAVNACRELAAILDGAATAEEADGFKAWIVSIAVAVAEAAKETDVRVSPAESALIDRVRAALLTEA